jgi:hypothetical protein
MVAAGTVNCPMDRFVHAESALDCGRLVKGVLGRLNNSPHQDDDRGTFATSEPDVWPVKLVRGDGGAPVVTRAILRVITYHGGRISLWAWSFVPVQVVHPRRASETKKATGAVAPAAPPLAAAPPPAFDERSPGSPASVSEGASDTDPVVSSNGNSAGHHSDDSLEPHDDDLPLAWIDEAAIEAELRTLADSDPQSSAFTGLFSPPETVGRP